jgi:hypothetical protein
MRTVLAAAFVLVASTASAQALQPFSPISVDILRGYELVGPITLTPETPGDELLFRNKYWRHVVVVAVPHATKSGVGGLIPAPGLCIEPAQAFAFFDPQITIADVNGDGLHDVIGIADGKVQPLMGSRLTQCR